MAQTEEICSQTQMPAGAAVWDTHTVSKHEAFDFYREGICAAFMPLRPECSKQGRRGFHAKVSSHSFGKTVLNLVSANVHSVLRGTGEIAASPEDCVYLNLQFGGQCTISQNDTSISLQRGELGVFDSSAPFALDHGESGTLEVASLMVPKRLLGDLAISTPLVLSHHPTLGRTLTEAVYALTQAVGTAAGKDVLLLQQLILQLAPAACQPPDLPTGPPANLLSRQVAQFLRIKQVVRMHCADPDFDLTRCGRIVGLSSGYIQQIFASQGARFTAVLLEERLHLARRNLVERAAGHLPVSTIAYRSGFRDVSHFGRAFKKHFGLSPGVWRSKASAHTH